MILDRLLKKIEKENSIERFVPYELPKNIASSSKVSIAATGGSFSKEKSRKREKLIWEFFMDELMHEIFVEYDKINKKRDRRGKISIHVPQSKYILLKKDELNKKDDDEETSNKEDALIMTFCDGKIYKDFPYDIKLNRSYKNFCYNIGTFCRVKENEGIIHGDPALRHFLYDLNKYKLHVIDWEKARTDCLNNVKKENDSIFGWLGDKMGNRLSQNQIKEEYNEGHCSVRGSKKNILEKSIKKIEEKYAVKIITNKRIFKIDGKEYKVDEKNDFEEKYGQLELPLINKDI